MASIPSGTERGSNAELPVDRSPQPSIKVEERRLTLHDFLKTAINADADGAMGMQQFAGDATLLYYLSEEAKEGKNAYLEKRKPNFKKFKRFP